MKAYELHKISEQVEVRLQPTRPRPQLNHGEVLIRVHAASLNFRDLMILAGRYPGQMKPDVIPLSDGAGEIVEVGPGVSSEVQGQRVTSTFFPNWRAGKITEPAIEVSLGFGMDGMLAEYVALPYEATIPIPEHLSYEEAATLPCAALTAWNALTEVGRVKAGDTVLLLGTGGVSMFALQFAKLLGATVIHTSSSEQKLERVKAMGADHLINYRNSPEWDRTVLDLTAGRGVDLVVEVGGAGTLERSLRAVKVGGIVATIGLVAGVGPIDPLPLISRAIQLSGVYVGSREMFLSMNKAIASAEIKPVIDCCFPIDEVGDAYEYMRSGNHLGKVVITI
uniref:Putative alcohol dehydrogenase zinc-binding domain protein n=1 Tax=Pseudomonas nitroreducens TaxID=46680 RepID=C3VA27_PSENT|nr:putative alcohol dehydrogenase zinc-binding domain protein [Pseudomonas nitroreducens]